MDQTAHNAEYTKKYNRAKILRLLRRQPMSRAELARATGLTRAASSLITEELIREGWLIEREPTPPSGQRGRQPIPLTVNGQACYAVGVFLNRTGCEIGISDFAGQRIGGRMLSLPDRSHLPHLADEIRSLSEENGIPAIAGIGISAPGPLDSDAGRILNPPHFEGWQDTDITAALTEALHVPVYLENDASALALYHRESGDSRDFLLLLVDNGIGSGVISGGQLLTSAGHFTCELGHTSIRFDGKLCECGHRGCLEAYAAIPSLLADDGGRYANWKEVIAAGDETLIDREAEYLSAAIVNLCNIIRIDTLYLAGDIIEGFPLLAGRLKKKLEGRTLSASPIRILPARTDPGIHTLAAAGIVFSKLLQA